MEEKIVFHCENVNLSYKTKQCLFNVNLDIYEKDYLEYEKNRY